MYRKVGDNDELKLENLNHEPVCGVWSEFCGKIFIESQSCKICMLRSMRTVRSCIVSTCITHSCQYFQAPCYRILGCLWCCNVRVD